MVRAPTQASQTREALRHKMRPTRDEKGYGVKKTAACGIRSPIRNVHHNFGRRLHTCPAETLLPNTEYSIHVYSKQQYFA